MPLNTPVAVYLAPRLDSIPPIYAGPAIPHSLDNALIGATTARQTNWPK